MKLSTRRKKLKSMIAKIDHEFGLGMLVLSDKKTQEEQSLSTGFQELDQELGCQGFPKGKIIELFGAPASGKTSFALSTIAAAQKDGALCAFIDLEHSFHPFYAKQLGVEIEHLLLAKPKSGQDALKLVSSLCSLGIDLIVFDSVAAISIVRDSAEFDHQGHIAQLMSQSLRTLVSDVNDSKSCLLFINQLRHIKNDDEEWEVESSGGYALKFYASIRLQLKQQLPRARQGKKQKMFVNIIKNRFGQTGKHVPIHIDFCQTKPEIVA